MKVRSFVISSTDLNFKRTINYGVAAVGSNGFLECLKQLIRIDADWVPQGDGYSLYIRPTAIGTSSFLGVHASSRIKLFTILSPVGPYYKSGQILI